MIRHIVHPEGTRVYWQWRPDAGDRRSERTPRGVTTLSGEFRLIHDEHSEQHGIAYRADRQGD